jgi:hypothetical protein
MAHFFDSKWVFTYSICMVKGILKCQRTAWPLILAGFIFSIFFMACRWLFGPAMPKFFLASVASPLQAQPLGLGFFCHFGQSCFGGLRKPPKNSKNHSPRGPCFSFCRSREAWHYPWYLA